MDGTLKAMYFNRMLRHTGIKQYQAQLNKLLQTTTTASEQQALIS
jgi:hypothetical protein